MNKLTYRMHTKGLLYLVAILAGLAGVSLPAETTASSRPVRAQALENSWPMLAANPERTSWTPEEVRGQLGVEWYRTIEPFVQTKTQVIAAEDKVFVSTARGLYAFDAASGAHLWTYGTELPLGHSPTYANGILFVGGYDRRIHAVNASNGYLKSGWGFVEAGAGFETNPLVINGRVYAGNRDGYFYCLDANNGSLLWKWRDDTDEWPNAPIRQSAAYRDGVFYFGSDNSHAYALQDNGVSAGLVWKSEKLPGVGFSTYWPVVYTEPSTGKVYVLFSGTKKEVGWVWFGDSYFQENYDIFASIPLGGLIGPTGTVPGDWVSGTRTIDASKIQQYFNQKPHKRHLFVLDAASGVEHPAFAPVSWVSTTHGGSKQPPVIGGDGVIYTHMGYKNGDPGLSPNAGASGGIAGWKFGTQHISQVYDFVRGYADEAVAFTAGGNVIYWLEGFNMGYGAFEINKPYGSNASWEYSPCGGIWGCLGIPGYDDMYQPCDVYGSCNGVYSGGSSSFTPYKGRVYLLERNALIAFSLSGGARRLPTVAVAAQSVPESSALPTNELSQRLEAEATKMLAAGHLRPGFHDSGLWGTAANGAFAPYVEGDHLAEYFHNPGDTVTTLLSALPYLSTPLQTQLKSYVKNNYGPGSTYDFTRVAHIGWKNGAQREIFTDTPERAALMSRAYDDPNAIIATVPRTYSQWNGDLEAWKFPQTSFYAAWKYAEVFPEEAVPVFNALKDKLEPTSSNPTYPTDAQFNKYPYLLNAYIAAYRGYMELERLAGHISNINASPKWGEYNRLLDLRVNNFSKDSYLTDGSLSYEKTMNVARNFMYMVPELAGELRARVGAQVQAAVTEYNDIEPYWFVSKFDRTYAEGIYQPLYDYHALFLAKAYILNEPYAELVKYLDVPAFYRGDLFYIQGLVAALYLAGTDPVAEFTAEPVTGPAPLTVQFTDRSTGNATSWAWDFQDDGTVDSRVQNPSHTYTSAGTYSVSLVATGPGGSSTARKAAYISVTAPPPDLWIPYITTNAADYPNGEIPKYEKLEITFQVENITAVNIQFPYDPNPPNGLDPSYPKHQGISVDALFLPPGQTDWNNAYQQPAFYYKHFDDQIKRNWEGADREWYYPTGEFSWKVRFAPNQPGTWQYKITEQDASGSLETAARSFTVVDSGKRGFIKVSSTDPRYFEFDDGTPFHALGFNGGGDLSFGGNLSDPVLGHESDFQTYRQNHINLLRVWISGMYGAAWSRYWGGRNIYDGYLPRSAIVPFYDPLTDRTTMTMCIDYEAEGDTGWFDACRFEFWDDPEAVTQNTVYRVRIKYRGINITGPRNPGLPYGFVGKLGGWHPDCYEPGTSTVITNYGLNNSDWGYIEGVWNSGNNNFLPRLYMALENVNAGQVYVDSISLRESLGNGQYGPEIMIEPSMEYELYFPEEEAYALDKLVRLAEQYDIHLKLVLMDKNDAIYAKMEDNGDFVRDGEDNLDGFYGVGRTVNKTRWLQQAWWRYLQARWGYSPSIQSWELTNEGDPANPDHYSQTDELGRYMHCRGIGVPVGGGDGERCTNDHPNAHLVTTSFWNSFPGEEFWANPRYPNVDYADVHAYVSTGWQNDPSHEDDAAKLHLDYSADVRSQIDWYSAQNGIPSKPVMRGETGIDFVDEQTEQPDLAKDTEGIWLHNFLWSTLDAGALTELYWWVDNIRAQPGPDGQPGLHEIYGNYSDFVSTIPLNNGDYQDAAAMASDPDLRVVGQKDLVRQRAHLWIQNKQHTWRNVVDRVSVAPLSGTVTLSGFQGGQNYSVQWWDTYATDKAQQTSTGTVTSQANGEIVLTISDMVRDSAVKIMPTTTTAPVAEFTAEPVTGTAPLTVQFGDKSTGSVESWAWDFQDDGTVDSGVQNPSYTYTSAGTCSVSLVVTGPGGSSTARKAGYISVAAPVPRFDLDVAPPTQMVDFGGVATYTAQITHHTQFAAPVTLQVGGSPSPNLMVHVDSPGLFLPPGGQAVVTLTDLHTTPSPKSGFWYTVPITATGDGVAETASIRLLVTNIRIYLPTILKAYPLQVRTESRSTEAEPGDVVFPEL